MSSGQEVVTRLEKDSTWFSHLKPKQKLFVAEYCLNGFEASRALDKIGSKKDSIANYLNKEPIQEAIKEFVSAVLADRASKLEAKITDVLWRRAFYNPMDFIDERGQPRTHDGNPFDPYHFDVEEYKKRLGAWSVCIDGIKSAMHPRSPDMISVTVELADRDKALKALSSYVGLTREEEGQETSFVVNVNVNPEKEKEATVIQEYNEE